MITPLAPGLTAITALYPALAHLSAQRLESLLRSPGRVRIPAGTELFAERQPCRGFPLILSGSIKVVKRTPAGREMLLYRVAAGESCIITSSCLLGHAPYSARGIAETELELLVLPVPLFEELLTGVPAFRDFVFQLFSERIAELMLLVEEVAFSRLDQRLARLLLSRGTDVIHTTHQQLAEELGSVREIVSRLLKGFAVQGLVSLGREQICLIDRAELNRLATLGHGQA